MNTLKKLVIISILGVFICNRIYADKLRGTENNGQGKPKSNNEVTAGCAPASGSTYLELNNVRALIHTGGDMWWDLQGKAKYEVPKGSGKTCFFATAIWIGGTDVNGQLKLAGMRYRQEGVDYWPGPLITGGEAQASVSPDICLAYDHHFIITKNEVSQFRSWYRSDAATRVKDFPGYQVPNIISNWPAHGPSGGYDAYLAPFYDNNNDGSYNPYDGDYPFFDLDNSLPCGTTRELRKPRLYGDQSLWWVYNDRGNLHTETKGEAIGFEIRAQAFAFATNDELNNMTFYNYALINRSTYTLIETYFGVWVDADLGYAYDDYVGCDVNRGLGYCYNGLSIDGTGQPEAYGGPNPPPPAVGVDFFEGPYQDANGVDDLSNWDNEGLLHCDKGYRYNPATGKKEYVDAGDFLNGNINGLNFGDGIIDNERWGMRRYIYFNNGGCPDMCDPDIAVQYYQYLRGYWKDGLRLTFGGTGRSATGTVTDFMFPGTTDDCDWGTAGNPPPAPTNPTLGWCEKGESNPVADRRLMQSAGPFTLEPGAVNDITVGAVWARATSGDEYESVKCVQMADDKAQKLFENCFKVLDGPDAPELHILEMNKQLIFHIWNKPGSNNYLEQYLQKDPFIVCPMISGVQLDCDKYYRFQGYQVFQLVDKDVSTAEFHDVSKARLVFQCDIKDAVSKLVNYTWSDDMQANVPVLEVSGSDEGVKHSFVLTEDVFAQGDKRLVNNKKYYYVAIAYAYNSYQEYDQNNPDTYFGQKMPYKAGRKGSDGAIKIYEVIPHINTPENGGTIINSEYGDGVEITQVEGHGNGANNLDLTDSTIAQILSGSPWKSLHPVYKSGKGPIDVQVIDPLNIVDDHYTLKMDTNGIEYCTTNSVTLAETKKNGLIKKAKWYVVNSKNDTINSDQWISLDDEKIIIEWGISIRIQQVGFMLTKQVNIPGYYEDPTTKSMVLGPVDNNGVIESSTVNSDESKTWLYWLPDEDGENLDASVVKSQNWIRSGSFTDTDYGDNNDYGYTVGDATIFWDPSQAYEKLINGGWAPYFLTSMYRDGPGYKTSFSPQYIDYKRPDGIVATGLNSVDIVITPDKSKWTRCPVIEMNDDKQLSIGNAEKFDLRRSPSVDRDGNTNTTEATANGTQPTGMGYFPGYAIDVETGQRLNMMYGEDSWLIGAHGNDMIWNPTSQAYSYLGESAIFGGKHYVYVIGNPVYNRPGSQYLRLPDLSTSNPNDSVYMANYDEGWFAYEYLKNSDGPNRRRYMATPWWVGIPILAPGVELKDGNTPLTEVKIRLRVAKPYRKGYKTWAVDTAIAENANFPMYRFKTTNLNAVTNDIPTAENALNLIGVVPNPYYGYNSYELNQTDNLVKIINLPKKCTVTIFTVNGTLVRKFNKDNESTIIEWDLKNNYGISISSGLYIIHIKADFGEKIVKWFGALRPIDLNAF
ncbi:MAG: T9SS type A sorting domain-containing protein [Bacteroidia bacterium]|nr:T9SS type A sorting domain-containing protein [Bacteroidia bacterium]